MPNVDELIDGVSQTITATAEGILYFTVLGLKYTYRQIRLTADTMRNNAISTSLEVRQRERICF